MTVPPKLLDFGAGVPQLSAEAGQEDDAQRLGRHIGVGERSLDEVTDRESFSR